MDEFLKACQQMVDNVRNVHIDTCGSKKIKLFFSIFHQIKTATYIEKNKHYFLTLIAAA
jgi:hypothetical protein